MTGFATLMLIGHTKEQLLTEIVAIRQWMGGRNDLIAVVGQDFQTVEKLDKMESIIKEGTLFDFVLHHSAIGKNVLPSVKRLKPGRREPIRSGPNFTPKKKKRK